MDKAMQDISSDQEFIYAQGKANLALEGMHLSAEQDEIARNYQSGNITKDQMIQKALEYARTR